MRPLTKIILSDVDDNELVQYKVWAYLKNHEDAFQDNKLENHRVNLLSAQRELRKIKENEKSITDSLKKRQKISKIDLVNEIIKREDLSTEEVRKNTHGLFELVDWTLSGVEDVLQKGRELYDETASQINIDWVSLASRDLSKGFIIVATPDRKLQTYTYRRRPILMLEGSKVSIVRTDRKENPVDTKDPWKLKQELLANRSPEEKTANENPATVLITVSTDFPLRKTVMPVARDKLSDWLKDEESTDSTALQKT